MDEYYLLSLYSFFSAFAILLCVAAAIDVAKYAIPNEIVVAVVVLFVVAAFAVPIETHWISHVGAAVVVFIAGALTYRFKVFGAGDIKLLTAVSLWAGFENLPFLLFYIALSGAGLTLVLVFVRRGVLAMAIRRPLLNGSALPQFMVIGEKIPYGVAIASGSMLLADDLPLLGLYL